MEYSTKMKILFVAIFSILIFKLLYSQAPDTLWTRTYGGKSQDCSYSIQETSDSGYIVVGNTYSFGAGESDVYLIKTDANGNGLWTETYGDSGYDYGRSVQQTSDGGFIIVGWTYFYGSPYHENVYLIKTDANGDTLWTKTYGGANRDFGYSVRELPSSGYIIAGHTKSYYTDNWDVYLIKTDENGNTIWMRTYGGTDDDYSYSVQVTSDSCYVIAGYTRSFGVGGYDVYLIKTYADGNPIWTKTYGDINNDFGYSIQEASDNGFIIAGYKDIPGKGDRDIYLIRTDANGDSLWTRTYEEVDDNRGYSVKETSDSGYIIAGFTYSSGTGDYDVYLIKTDANGDTLWTGTYGGSDWDFGYSVQQTADGGYVITGYTYSFGAGSEDVYLIKLAPEIGIEEENYPKVGKILLRIHPNPFCNKTLISFYLSEPIGYLEILDATGRRIYSQRLAEEGKHRVIWKSERSGVYFIRLKTRNRTAIEKTVSLR